MEKKNRMLAAGAVFMAVCVLLGGAGFAMKATSSTEYCMTCHEMTRYREELSKSSHARDARGAEIECRQCHLPLDFGPKYMAVKVYSGAKDIYAHNFGDPENLPRVMLQASAARLVLDENCLACHQDLTRNAKGDGPVSLIGQLSHDAYLGKNGTTKRNCAGCHRNMAHLPDHNRRIRSNAAFAEKLNPQWGGN